MKVGTKFKKKRLNWELNFMQDTFRIQQDYFANQPVNTPAKRIENLKRIKQEVLAQKDQLIEAMSDDFGFRSKYDSLFGDIISTVNCLNYCIKNIKKWTKPEKRSAGLLLSPAKVWIEYQPLGVVGIISPWNFPVMLSIGAIAYAISAGNCVMLKMSEETPHTNKVVSDILSTVFRPEEVAVITGGSEIAAEFSRLPFNHLLFTGSTAIGKKVMQAAAMNLTPVTLELGGKSPVIIDSKIDINEAVSRIIMGKCLNAGQICIAPDYVLLPKGRQDEFVAAYKNKFNQLFKADNYTDIINTKQFDRIQGLITDAKSKGAKVIECCDFDGGRKMSTKLLTGVNGDMQVMKEEIFGPLLPIVSYDDITQAIAYVNERDRPLALYIMSFDSNFQKEVLSQTHSGGVGINEVVMHFAADDLPFGGVGQSGMGRYHGVEGFKTFSNSRAILKRGRFFNTGKVAQPPYGTFVQNILLKFFLR